MATDHATSQAVAAYPLYAKVILDRAPIRPLDYGIPEEFLPRLRVGMRVTVPVRNQLRKGTVLTLEKSSSFEQVYPIYELLSDKDVLTEDLFLLADFISRYYCTPLSKATSCILPSSVRKDTKELAKAYIQRGISLPKLRELTSELRHKRPKQAEVLDILLEHPKGLFLTDLLNMPRITLSPVKTLVKQGILIKESLAIDRSLLEDEEFFQLPPKELNEEQQQVFSAISEDIEVSKFHTHLIYGITGSGKTEVYMQLIQKALDRGKGIIVLVPEIALTTQTIERFKSRFTTRIAILHHRLSDGERVDAWHRIRKGEIPIVVGARSAIFSPIPNLGLIIVDEEHEMSYKQIEDTPSYHARDVAIKRAQLTNSVVVLGSATPSIESMYNAKQGKFTLHTIHQRAGNAQRPKITIIDMKHECEKQGPTLFSDPLLSRIEKNLKEGSQTILFLNRRGYFTCQVCTECHEPLKCRHCDVSLTYHKSQNYLSCHICDYTIDATVEVCPHCKCKETLKYRGPGTEQVERAIHAIFPTVRTLRMDRDTTKHKGSHDKLFKAFKSGKADVLIGTQMIAKGLHFPNVTLVGVLNGDSSFHIPDYRSNESVFQLITQVAGRAGRGEMPGEVVIQTFLPDHPIIQLASKEDYEAFYQSEIEERKLFVYPPFSRLAKVIFSGPDPQKVEKFAQKYHGALQKQLSPKRHQLLPLSPCGYAKIKDRHRFQLIIKSIAMMELSQILQNITLYRPRSISLHIDIDAISTFS